MIAHEQKRITGLRLYAGIASFNNNSLEKEISLCKKYGLKEEVLRKYNYNALQLAEIRKGLEAKVDVGKYINPKLSWLEMEEIRLELMEGFDLTSYRDEGFNNQQVYQIRKGLENDIDVSIYAKKEFLAEQMKQIRKGLVFSKDFPVIFYLDPAFDGLQMKEIRKGLEAQIDVSNYAHVEMPYMKMRIIRESAEDGLFFSDEQIRKHPYGVLDQMHKAFIDNVDLSFYIERKYDAEQLDEIRIALKEQLYINDYISPDMRGDAIREIRLGIEHGVLVDQYADPLYNWQQMHEMRLGLENQIDISCYCKYLYWPDQMREIRLGLEEGLDVSRYTSMMYTARDMRRIREQLLLGTFSFAEDNDVAESEIDVNSKSSKKILVGLLDNKDKYLSISHKNMLCWFTIPDGAKKVKYTEDIILAFLNKCGIRHGINKSAIVEMINEQKPGEKYLIASGDDAVDGKDGYYEYFFKSSGRCELSENNEGEADFSKLDEIVKVNVGSKLAQYHKSTKGLDGRDIFGKTLFAKKGKEIPILKGEGFMILNDRVTYVAKYTGALTISDGDLFVKKILVLPEVKITDKIIRYDGTVLVTGDVYSGSEIHATGDIVISGHMESSTLVSGGNVSIKGGAKCPVRGGIDAKGNVSGKYFEGVRISAQNVYANSFVNCTIISKGVIKTYGTDGIIYGGTLQSLFGIEAANLGSKGGTKTIISLGVFDNVLNDYNQLKKELARETEDYNTLNAEKERLQEIGPVSREMLQWKIKINAAATVKAKMIDEINEKLKGMEGTIKKGDRATALISNTIYSGVIFVISGVMHKFDKDRKVSSPVTIRVDGKKENILVI